MFISLSVISIYLLLRFDYIKSSLPCVTSPEPLNETLCVQLSDSQALPPWRLQRWPGRGWRLLISLFSTSPYSPAPVPTVMVRMAAPPAAFRQLQVVRKRFSNSSCSRSSQIRLQQVRPSWDAWLRVTPMSRSARSPTIFRRFPNRPLRKRLPSNEPVHEIFPPPMVDDSRKSQCRRRGVDGCPSICT